MIMKIINKLNVLYYLIVLYICNYYYEIQNKQAFISSKGFNYEFVCLLACAQIEVGMCYIFLLWLIPDGRKFPNNIYLEDLLKILPTGICTSISHYSLVYSLCSRYGNKGILQSFIA